MDEEQDVFVCPICMEKINDDPFELACKHVYHKRCLFNWLGNKTCLTCKKKWTSFDKYKIYRNVRTIPNLLFECLLCCRK